MKLSVVIPLYNKAPFIARAIQSVLAQDQEVDEIIVVDDGSTDGGPEVVEAMGLRNLRMIRQENGGPGAARNRGALEASHPWVALLDADDWWAPHHVSTVSKLLSFNSAASVVACAYQSWGPNGPGAALNVSAVPSDPFVGDAEDWFRVAVLSGPVFCASAVVIRKSAWEAVGGFREDMRYGEDTDMWMRLVSQHSFVFGRDITAYYWQEGNSVDTASTRARGLDGFRAPHFTEWPQAYSTNGFWQAEFVARRQLQLLGELCREGYRTEVREALRHIHTRHSSRAKQVLWMKTWLPAPLLRTISTVKSTVIRARRLRP